ncbi:MAG: type II secretion system inner membrane protein GspF [Deltaproteobacteria bacterium]|nr:type II secretion system inner membrane protein GspF [Deltaproteobacteria bacterium]MCW5802423.1 type II secretion system inner membrane protein GspF [Deltaproteobacteria bacterium]
MPMYAYKGISPSGKNVSGTRDADSPKTLRQVLRKDGVLVTSFELSRGGKQAKAENAKKRGLSRDVDLGGLLGGVKKVEIAAFTRQLATLLKSGIPLAESLGALVDQVLNPRFRVQLSEVRTAVNEGMAFGDALAKHPKIFDELFVSMVRAGELAGNLDEVLTRLADFLESSQKLKSKVTGAMIYPMVMLGIGTIIIAVLMIKVIPEITKTFSQAGKTLPINTRFLIGVSGFIGRNWIFLALGIAAAIALFVNWKASAGGKPIWHRFVLGLPAIGPLVRTINVARFSRTLGTMLASGVPMLRAMDAARQTMGNVILQKVVEDAKKAVTEGESLAVTLRKSGQFPPTMLHMVAVGEKAGQLEQMLERVADTYEAEIDTKLSRFISLLEPLMLLGMGIAVAFIVISILQPIMDLGSISGGPK